MQYVEGMVIYVFIHVEFFVILQSCSVIGRVGDSMVLMENGNQVGGAEYRSKINHGADGDTIPCTRLDDPHTGQSIRGVLVALIPMDKRALITTLAVVQREQEPDLSDIHAEESSKRRVPIDKDAVVSGPPFSPIGSGPDELSAHTTHTGGIAGSVKHCLCEVVDEDVFAAKRRAGGQRKGLARFCGIRVELVEKEPANIFFKGRQTDEVPQCSGGARILAA